jgi:hypothetical protein
MRRLLWLLAGLGLLATGVYLAGRAPSAYVLEKECERYHERRRDRLNLIAFHIARADKDALPDLRRQMDDLLRETKTVDIRGWEVVLVPAGARAPGPPYTLGARVDPSAPPDPPPLKGPMEAWITPRGFLARLFARR